MCLFVPPLTRRVSSRHLVPPRVRRHPRVSVSVPDGPPSLSRREPPLRVRDCGGSVDPDPHPRRDRFHGSGRRPSLLHHPRPPVFLLEPTVGAPTVHLTFRSPRPSTPPTDPTCLESVVLADWVLRTEPDPSWVPKEWRTSVTEVPVVSVSMVRDQVPGLDPKDPLGDLRDTESKK